jgi:uncharacterized Zn finger protein
MNSIKHERPLCPHCSKVIETLGCWTDKQKISAILFCPECGKVLGVQLLLEKSELE